MPRDPSSPTLGGDTPPRTDAALLAELRSLDDPGELFLDAEGLGRMLGIGDASLPGRCRAAINQRRYLGLPLPPSIRLPGTRARVWYVPTVIKWIAAFEEGAPAKRGPGRPPKAVAAAWRAAKSGEGS